MSAPHATKLVNNHDVNLFPGVRIRHQNIPQLQDLLIVYPIVIAIVKGLSLRELISLALTNKSCFAFLRGGNWGDDQHRWDNLRSNCNEICEFTTIHEYFPRITAIKSCQKCKYGVCNHCVGPVGHLGSRRRGICSYCIEKRLSSHIRYQNKTEFPECLCTSNEPWLCQMCWRESYLSTFKESAGKCCDCSNDFVVGDKVYFVCKWCKGKLS